MTKGELLRRCAYHEGSHATACLCLGIPIIRVCIDTARPHLHRADYHPPSGIGLQAMCILALSGPIGEQYFCGAANDGSDQADVEMAKSFLARAGFDLLGVEAEIMRFRAAAERLVCTEQRRIRLIADALLKRGSLTAQEIYQLGQSVS